MLDSATRGVTLAMQVARQLEDMITSGEWPVGTRIPPENQLMAKLDVSRNTLREGIRSLVHLGLLEARAGDGTYVRSHSVLEAPFLRRAMQAGATDAIEFRAILERAAAGLAARRRTARDVTRLRKLLRQQLAAGMAEDRSAYAAADDALHRAVLACSGNSLLAEVYDLLGGALKFTVSVEVWNRALAMREVKHHAALVEAIANKDERSAERAATELIEALREAMRGIDSAANREDAAT